MEWHTNEQFWEAVGPFMFSAAQLEAAPAEVEQAIKLVGLPDAGRVLDLPCGIGRHSIEFARRGHRVTAVDRTATYLTQARSRAGQAGVSIEFVQADMREFVRPGTFDLVLNLFTSFGYFETVEEESRTLANFLASLKPGGRLVMDLMGKEVLARIFQARDWSEGPEDAIMLQERKICDGWAWTESRWIVMRGGERVEQTVRLRLYSATELLTLLTQAGFVDCRAYGSVAGTPYDQAAARLVCVARRPE